MTRSRGQAKIGVLVPYTNTNLEADMALMSPSGVSFHYARLGGYDVDEIPDSEQMAGLGTSDLDEPIRLLNGVRPNVILYGCTSATLALGAEFDENLAKKIAQSSGCQTVTAAGALVYALQSLDIKKIGFTSPYVPRLNDEAIGFLADNKIETVSRSEVGSALGNYEQSALTPKEVLELGLAADCQDVEAIVLSCTDMRAVEIIEEIERTVKKPVITSNQAMLYQALSFLPDIEPSFGFGKIFDSISPVNWELGKVLP